ncbi:Ribonuclease [Pantoea ananatis]|uniref:ribonuclease domain-containing protein n=1 Tax=Pantoea ananas TaxID=553 RepID=UPI0021F7CCAC|nr:ribonuclease domain-containing protein [Pantoea ananatis]MCW0317122.1 Ribonuclease [Pantoea ananatis]MCW0335262.1 Ribonuclease [Pantoea ananatis]MCW0382907.1 Ribonuclease [Pantoea ananatis]MCW0407571.1 Ribonuclease [Pantoea ananatis]MCW0427745.1 Ribonuclease [Pantoea ananatis]
MSKKLWVGLVLILVLCWVGLRPYLTSAPAKTSASDIAALTDVRKVARWVLQHQQLPDYYITKKQARRLGWNPAKGDLCEVLPGRAIGGDRFSNRERKLPERADRQWFEADVNYRCGHREADRLVYSSDGLVFLSTDHYRTFKPVQ